MTKTRLFQWCTRFKEGRQEVEDDHRSGRPSTSGATDNIERVRLKVWSNRRLTVQMIADELGMNSGLTVRMIADELGMNSERVRRIVMEDLEMKKICAKMVPKLLNEGQTERRVQVCQDILEQLKTEPKLLKRVVTDNELWLFEYDPLIKQQSLEWKNALSPRPKNARVFKPKTKVMLIAFFDVYGIELSTQNS